MIYILDAYNVIHKVKSLDAALDKNLRAGREALTAFCQNLLQKRGDISKIILVFDGRTEFHDLPHTRIPKIEMVFSDTGEDADERIAVVMEGLGDARKCVVSDDNSVRNHARAYKASSISVAEFEAMAGPSTVRKRPQTAPSKEISPRAADEITAAYKKHLGL